MLVFFCLFLLFFDPTWITWEPIKIKIIQFAHSPLKQLQNMVLVKKFGQIFEKL